MCGSLRTPAASPLAQVHYPVGPWTRMKASSMGMRSGMLRWEGLHLEREASGGASVETRAEQGKAKRGVEVGRKGALGWVRQRSSSARTARGGRPGSVPKAQPGEEPTRSDVRQGSFRRVRGCEVPLRGKRSRERDRPGEGRADSARRMRAPGGRGLTSPRRPAPRANI